jgi:(p)ppGpp synthase/HD superfamily hydrolase
MDPVEAAVRQLAIERHAAAGKRYGASPYEVHLQAVHQVLVDFGHQGALLVAAWAHDLLEDTLTTREEIERIAGPMVGALVWAVTGVGRTREECWASVVPKIRALPLSVHLKLADRIANVEASRRGAPRLYRMYAREQPMFEASLQGHGDPRMWARLRAAFDDPGKTLEGSREN